ncbi:MAG: energy transducer TonB [Bacteroides sp.]|nr:energy transducer TonB [Bacteroides sp.]
MKKLLLTLTLALAMALGASAAETPTFPGGDTALREYISSNLKYPASAAENGIEGVVSVRFTVHADGSIGTIEIVRMIDPDLEQEAIRLVKGMPAWTPADRGGSPVEATVTLPITFSLD